MKKEKLGESIKSFEEELLEKVKKMSNKELRKGFWEARKGVMAQKEPTLLIELQEKGEVPKVVQKKLIQEEMFSRELERRGLLQWALKTGKTKEKS